MSKSNTGATIQLVSRGAKSNTGECYPAVDDFTKWFTAKPSVGNEDDGKKTACSPYPRS